MQIDPASYPCVNFNYFVQNFIRMNKPYPRCALLLVVVFSLLHIAAAGQQPIKTYEKEWKKVDDLAAKQLPKSALIEVKKIYVLAKKEKQDAQVIKALVYMIDLQSDNREANLDSSILEMEKEIRQSQEPATSILNSLLAELYWGYYESIRWQLYNRSETINFKKNDLATWSTEDFHKKIS